MVASAALFVRATGLILEACGAIGYVHGMVLCTCSCKLINVNGFCSYANSSTGVSMCRLQVKALFNVR